MTPVLSRTLAAAALVASSLVYAADVRVGAGAYSTDFKLGTEVQPPAAPFKTPRLRGPVPTNDWVSSVLFTRWSHPMFAHPAAYQASENGFEISQPKKEVRANSIRNTTDIVYPHEAQLTVKPLGFEMVDARLDKSSDWAADIVIGDGKESMTVTIAHGNPFSYYEVSTGDVQVQLAGGSSVFHRSDDGRVLGVIALEKPFALYAPQGGTWEVAEQTATLRLPPKARYFSIAALPDAQPETAAAFRKYAFNFVVDTRVSWKYDEAKSEVTTDFNVLTRPKEGKDEGVLFGLYTHQWYNNPLLGKTLPYEYETVRGKMKTVAGKRFQTRYTYHGILPCWPRVTDAEQLQRLNGFLAIDAGEGVTASHPRRAYWQGKALAKGAQLLAITACQGEKKMHDRLLGEMKSRMEEWFNLEDNPPGYFHYSKDLGTLIAYPAEFGSAEELNDHHFHYGYWITAAGHVALRDSQWGKRYAGIVDLLIRDIASTVPSDPMFPRLRHFDPYAGHSWASGVAQFGDGNNQESSSEAINAWAGMILFAEATGNKKLRDDAIYLYTTEVQAAHHYWFDIYDQVFAPEFKHEAVGILWGGKYEVRTWWTNDPLEIHGINFLPITGASLYLGKNPDYVRRNIEAMREEFVKFKEYDHTDVPEDRWQDILNEYYALYDAETAMKQWKEFGGVETGETAAHTYYWLQGLINMGRPDFTVTANTPLYSVFRKGDVRTYVAYNAGAKAKRVTFSDGKALSVPPRSVASMRATVKK